MTLEDGRMSIEISAYGENNRLLYDQTYGVNSERVLVGAIHMGSPELPEFPRMGGTPDDDIDVVGLPQKHFASITPFVPVSGTVRTLENALLREFQNDVNKSMQFNQSAIVEITPSGLFTIHRLIIVINTNPPEPIYSVPTITS